jgi:hypothetical protein
MATPLSLWTKGTSARPALRWGAASLGAIMGERRGRRPNVRLSARGRLACKPGHRHPRRWRGPLPATWGRPSPLVAGTRYLHRDQRGSGASSATMCCREGLGLVALPACKTQFSTPIGKRSSHRNHKRGAARLRRRRPERMATGVVGWGQSHHRLADSEPPPGRPRAHRREQRRQITVPTGIAPSALKHPPGGADEESVRATQGGIG